MPWLRAYPLRCARIGGTATPLAGAERIQLFANRFELGLGRVDLGFDPALAPLYKNDVQKNHCEDKAVSGAQEAEMFHRHFPVSDPEERRPPARSRGRDRAAGRSPGAAPRGASAARERGS